MAGELIITLAANAKANNALANPCFQLPLVETQREYLLWLIVAIHKNGFTVSRRLKAEFLVRMRDDIAGATWRHEEALITGLYAIGHLRRRTSFGGRQAADDGLFCALVAVNDTNELAKERLWPLQLLCSCECLNEGIIADPIHANVRRRGDDSAQGSGRELFPASVTDALRGLHALTCLERGASQHRRARLARSTSLRWRWHTVRSE